MMAWVVAPTLGGSTRTLPDPFVRRLKIVVHSCLGLLLLTGIYNVVMAMTPEMQAATEYQVMLGVKFLLYAAVFAMAIVLFRKGGPTLISDRAQSLLTWMAVLTLIILLFSGYLNLDRIRILTTR